MEKMPRSDFDCGRQYSQTRSPQRRQGGIPQLPYDDGTTVLDERPHYRSGRTVDVYRQLDLS